MKKTKEHLVYVCLIILVSLFVARYFIFNNTAMVENDVDFHYSRALSTSRAWLDHQIIPQLDPTGASGMGFAWNLFYGPLPTYFIAILYLITHRLAFALNSVTVMIVCLIGLMMYRYIYYRTKSEKSSFIAAIALITSTTVLNNLYQYTGYGPLFGTFFAIVTLYGIQIILDAEKPRKGVVLLSVGAAGILLSHTLTCLIMIFYIFWLLIAHFKTVLKQLKYFIVAAVLSFGLSAYFILPFFEAKNYQLYNQFNPIFTSVYMWQNPDSMNNIRASIESMLFASPGVSAYPSVLFWLSLVICLIVWFIKVKQNANKKNATLFFIFATTTLVLCGNWLDWHYMPSATWTLQSPIRIMFYASGILFSISLGLSTSIILKRLKHHYLKTSVTVVLTLLFIFLATVSINSPFNNFNKDTIRLEAVNETSSIAFKGNGGGFVKTAIGEFFPSAIGTTDKSLKEITKEDRGAYYFTSTYIYPAIDKRKQAGAVFLNTGDRLPDNQIDDVPFRSDYKVTVKSADSQRILEIPKIAYPGYKARFVSDSGKGQKLKVGPSSNGYVQVTIPKQVSGQITIYYGMSSATLIGLILLVVSIITILVLLFLRKNGDRIKEEPESAMLFRSRFRN